MLYVKNKGALIDQCNLCRALLPLTWDHVPPKGGIVVNNVEMRSINQVFTGDSDQQKPTYSQNGVKFRSLCKGCNDLLGHSYDPALNEFAIAVGQALKSSLKIPEFLSFSIKPNKVSRAVLGHLIAGKIGIPPSTFDDIAREYVLNPKASFPESISIFFWVYPYPETIVMRDFALADFNNSRRHVPFCQILKYFPIAYLVADTNVFEGLPRLSIHLSADLDQSASIRLRLNDYKAPLWPEEPTGMKVLFGGEALMQSTHAIPRRPLIKGLKKRPPLI